MSEVADTFRRPSVLIESTAKSKQSQPQLRATANKKLDIMNQYEHITKKYKWCYDNAFSKCFHICAKLCELIFFIIKTFFCRG